MTARRRYPARWVPALALLTTLAVAACADSKPAICGDVNDLQKSVQNLKNISIDQNTLSTITNDLNTIKQQLSEIVTDAKQQYANEIQQLTSSVSALSAGASAAAANSSAATLAPLVPQVSAVGDAAKGLATAVSSTC